MCVNSENMGKYCATDARFGELNLLCELKYKCVEQEIEKPKHIQERGSWIHK